MKLQMKLKGIEAESVTEAIATHFNVQIEDIEQQRYDHYGMSVYWIDGSEYAIGAEQEADAACWEYIKDSVWAFNPQFILEQCDFAYSKDAIASLGKMQGDRCESANDFIIALIKGTCGLEAFIEAAISADGRGHFLASYDSNEIEIKFGDDLAGLLAYRIS